MLAKRFERGLTSFQGSFGATRTSNGVYLNGTMSVLGGYPNMGRGGGTVGSGGAYGIGLPYLSYFYLLVIGFFFRLSSTNAFKDVP